LLIELPVDRIVLGLMLGAKASILRRQPSRAHWRIDLGESCREQAGGTSR
jgi:hypothetical protein